MFDSVPAARWRRVQLWRKVTEAAGSPIISPPGPVPRIPGIQRAFP